MECQRCKAEDKAKGARDRFGKWISEDAIDNLSAQEGVHRFGVAYPKLMTIALTEVQGIDTTRILCQRCVEGQNE